VLPLRPACPDAARCAGPGGSPARSTLLWWRACQAHNLIMSTQGGYAMIDQAGLYADVHDFAGCRLCPRVRGLHIRLRCPPRLLLPCLGLSRRAVRDKV
jgi:hypothetical protein